MDVRCVVKSDDRLGEGPGTVRRNDEVEALSERGREQGNMGHHSTGLGERGENQDPGPLAVARIRACHPIENCRSLGQEQS